MRSSFILRYEPELLGELSEEPVLKGMSEQDILEFMEKNKQRMDKASQIPTEKFDIDFHKFIKKINDEEYMHIDVEKKYISISGGVSGSSENTKQFDRIYKDIYRYYGVSKDDIAQKSERYDEVVRVLSMEI